MLVADKFIQTDQPGGGKRKNKRKKLKLPIQKEMELQIVSHLVCNSITVKTNIFKRRLSQRSYVLSLRLLKDTAFLFHFPQGSRLHQLLQWNDFFPSCNGPRDMQHNHHNQRGELIIFPISSFFTYHRPPTLFVLPSGYLLNCLLLFIHVWSN